MKRRRVPLYDSDVYFTNDAEDAKAFIRRHSDDEEEQGVVENCRGCCYTVIDSEDRHYRMICVFDGDLNTVVHESVHMAWIVMDYCQVKITYSNNEPLAYLTGWIATEMLRLFPDKKRPRK